MENNNKYEKTFMISCKEVKSDNQKFIASTAKIQGKWYKIKFKCMIYYSVVYKTSDKTILKIWSFL